MDDSFKALCEMKSSSDVVFDVKHIVEEARATTYRYVNTALVIRNWLLGKRISEEILKEGNKENYGKKLITTLSKQLSADYGKGFKPTELYFYVRFHKTFPDFLSTVSQKSFLPLTWSHYRAIIKVEDEEERSWYEKEASHESWSVRTLQRNIDSQYYYRVLMSTDRKPVRLEMKRLTADYERDKSFIIKDPVVMEFLGLTPDASLNETKLESSIISNLQNFLLEMGKGYAFVARQQRIHTENEDYYIDLVFYNIYLKCYVLVDLKTSKVTHQDVGQMDMYVRMYDELKRMDSDNPTLGIILCSKTDEDIAKYSVLHDNDRLFASKYKLYLPSEDELRREIETQKQLFEMRKKESEKDGQS